MSHPLPADRIANLETLARQSPYFDVKDPAALQQRHDMMRAKLFGFAGKADEVARRYPASDTSLAARPKTGSPTARSAWAKAATLCAAGT